MVRVSFNSSFAAIPFPGTATPSLSSSDQREDSYHTNADSSVKYQLPPLLLGLHQAPPTLVGTAGAGENVEVLALAFVVITAATWVYSNRSGIVAGFGESVSRASKAFNSKVEDTVEAVQLKRLQVYPSVETVYRGLSSRFHNLRRATLRITSREDVVKMNALFAYADRPHSGKEHFHFGLAFLELFPDSLREVDVERFLSNLSHFDGESKHHLYCFHRIPIALVTKKSLGILLNAFEKTDVESKKAQEMALQIESIVHHKWSLDSFWHDLQLPTAHKSLIAYYIIIGAEPSVLSPQRRVSAETIASCKDFRAGHSQREFSGERGEPSVNSQGDPAGMERDVSDTDDD